MDEGTGARRHLYLVYVPLLRDRRLDSHLVMRPYVTIATSLLLRTPVPTAQWKQS
jgi:hypothetical protein